MDNNEFGIVNRVAQSGLITLDIADFYPKGERVLYDLKQNLFMEAILREKEFREFVKTHDWSQYNGKHVAVTCSVEAIIPAWAYMILATKLEQQAKTLVFGDLEDLENYLYRISFSEIDLTAFEGAKVVIKGCGDFPIPPSAYFELTRRLAPHVSSIMYGEPCSTVPVFKKGK